MWNHLSRFWALHVAWILGLVACLWPPFLQYLSSNPKTAFAAGIAAMIAAHASPQMRVNKAAMKGLSLIVLMTGAFSIGALIAGCSTSAVSVLDSISEWAPFASTAFGGFVSLVAPANSGLANYAQSIEALINNVGTAAAAAAQADTGTNVQKVVAEINTLVPQVTNFENGLEAAGVNISANDQKYIHGGAALAVATIEGYEAVLQAQTPAGSSSGATAMNAVYTPDGCAGFIPPKYSETSFTPGRFYANCDKADDAIDVQIERTSQTTKTTVVTAKKPPTLDNWKRQFNALARKYGHPEKQLTISRKDSLVHILTIGKR